MCLRNLRVVVFLAASICLVSLPLCGEDEIRCVEFAGKAGISVNGAGPLLVRADPARQRVVVVNHLTASLSLIRGSDDRVTGIPLAGRIPHYLKASALALHPHTGAIYLAGDRCLHVADPDTRTSRCLPIRHQAEMVAINRTSGVAYLVGRESPYLVVADPASGKVRYRSWLRRTEPMRNRNATPPPPLRKVIWDDGLQKVFAFDADTREMAVFSPSGKLLGRRTLAVARGRRWHLAGFDAGSHNLFLVIETDQRKVVQAVRIHLKSRQVSTLDLPGLTEAVGVSMDPRGDRIYIPYDNHPTVHMVEFGDPPGCTEIAVPAFGNDASLADPRGNRLYIAEWAHSEVLEIDLLNPRDFRRHRNVEVLPHMFNMAFLPGPSRLYIPSGATAVNGAFGASLTRLDTGTGKASRVETGWAPVGMAPRRDAPGVLVINSENRMALVDPDGTWRETVLPGRYFHRVIQGDDGRVYASFGAHQSYWPVHYIGGAWNGVVDIDPHSLSARWRRLPRLAQAMTLDDGGRLFALQNNWGEEEQFLAVFSDPVREFDPGKRWKIGDRVTRETTQRLLAWDRDTDCLFVVRLGEKSGDPGVLQVVSASGGALVRRLEVGRTPVDLCLAGDRARICAFDDHCLVEVNKKSGAVTRRTVGRQPIAVRSFTDGLAVLCQGDRTLWLVPEDPGSPRILDIGAEGTATGMFVLNGRIWVTLHDSGGLRLLRLDPGENRLRTVMHAGYPYGKVTADQDNAAFFMRGQYGDCRYDLCHMCVGRSGRIYLSDFLSGRLWILPEPTT